MLHAILHLILVIYIIMVVGLLVLVIARKPINGDDEYSILYIQFFLFFNKSNINRKKLLYYILKHGFEKI